MTLNHQPYQGYPYVNPMVTDAPSIDAAQAARWANLPRRAISTTVPGPSGSGIGRGNPPPSTSGSRLPSKDIDDNPVLYIDVPEASGSEVSQSVELEREPEYVQNTILYDPFENRRITPKEDSASEHSSVSEGAGSPLSARADRPNRLNWMDQGSSSNQNTPQNNLPPVMSKESYIYGRQPEGYPLNQVQDISGFPEPPPAYTEVAVPHGRQTPAAETSNEPEQPRTQVIVPNTDPVSAVGIMTFERKFVVCQHCGSSVHTLVVRETGFLTYLLFCFLFLVIMPFAIVVFFIDTFKHKNHYCPNCNRMIGYQLPFCSSEFHTQ